MKRVIVSCVYGLFGLLAMLGTAAAVYLYPTHAAHGTSVAYYTMILLPTVFLLTGLTSVFWRYWWCLLAGGLTALAVYLYAAEPGNPVWLVFPAVYLVCGSIAGMAGSMLRTERKTLRKST